jgi:hypothetical protein
MPVRLYMDVHVPRAIADQLRRRGVDVITAIEDHAERFQDDILLDRARVLGCVLFTQDIRFKALAEEWQRQGRRFAGVAFAHPLRATIGELVTDLELIALASEPEEWLGTVEYLPFRSD